MQFSECIIYGSANKFVVCMLNITVAARSNMAMLIINEMLVSFELPGFSI